MALGTALSKHFPQDCANLSISGGWGYTQTSAIVLLKTDSELPFMSSFVPIEYHIADKIVYEELIIFRPKGYKFSGIRKSLKRQSLMTVGSRKFDKLQFAVTCWSDWHWEQLKDEWEANDFGNHPGFDRAVHEAKRRASQINYDREFWFDISEVFNGA